MTLARTVYGAGTRQLPDRPNIASVTLGTPAASVAGTGEAVEAPEGVDGVEDSEVLEVLETNLDDVTGETLGHVITRALATGALDAWVTPAVMKKGRPAHILHILARPAGTPTLWQLIFTETRTLGIRTMAVTRTRLPRHTTTIDLDGIPIRVKHGPHGSKPEHDDLAAAAARLGLPLRTLAERAKRIAAAGEPASAERGLRSPRDQEEGS